MTLSHSFDEYLTGRCAQGRVFIINREGVFAVLLPPVLSHYVSIIHSGLGGDERRLLIDYLASFFSGSNI